MGTWGHGGGIKWLMLPPKNFRRSRKFRQNSPVSVRNGFEIQFQCLLVNQFSEIFEKSSKCYETAPYLPFLALRARKSENLAIEASNGRNSAIENPLPQRVVSTLYLVFGSSKGLVRGLVLPCLQL